MDKLRMIELLTIAENSGNMHVPEFVQNMKRETYEERQEILAFWKKLPGYFTYVGTLRKMVEETEKGEKQ